MNTPAHVAASLLLWRNESTGSAAAAITVGAILPDAPMFGFYAYQKLMGQSEASIWSTHYFADRWQLLFDLFNSAPLMLVVIGISYAYGWRFGGLLAASALLHILCDFPLHHDDAHRHLLPLTHWRFASPVSYWDPKHFGHIFMWFELTFALGSCIFVMRTSPHQSIRAVAIGTLTLYLIGMAFAALVWLPQLNQIE
jgi:hypothetical protein